MSDGANIGITADRALATILGGEGQPEEAEKLTPEQVRARVMACPSPLDEQRPGDYGEAADCIAKAFLLVEESAPGTLAARKFWTPENTTCESLWGKEQDANAVAWEECCARWPGFDEWIGGASGFQVGFAYNTACYVLGIDPAPNPAIVTVGE